MVRHFDHHAHHNVHPVGNIVQEDYFLIDDAGKHASHSVRKAAWSLCMYRLIMSFTLEIDARDDDSEG